MVKVTQPKAALVYAQVTECDGSRAF